MIVQDEIVQVANEAGQMYWEEVEVSIQSDGGLQEYVDKAISKKKEELYTIFGKTQAVANPAHSPGFLEQVSVAIRTFVWKNAWTLVATYDWTLNCHDSNGYVSKCKVLSLGEGHRETGRE
jgi:hypothetical protein